MTNKGKLAVDRRPVIKDPRAEEPRPGLRSATSDMLSKAGHVDPLIKSRLRRDPLLSIHLAQAISAIEGSVGTGEVPFRIAGLRLGQDPENPGWKPIEIRVEVPGLDYAAVLVLWDAISAAVGKLSLPEDIHILVD